MPIKNKTIVLQGKQAAISALKIAPQSDGSAELQIAGITKDGSGQAIQLEVAVVAMPGSSALLKEILRLSLSELRKKNGLE